MPNYDAPYEETDRISPHYAHMIQPLNEGAWRCIDCDGPLCYRCQREPTHDELELCGECISEEVQYYADMRDEREGGQG